MIYSPGTYQIAVHHAFVPVDHQVRIDPVIERPGAPSHRARLRLRSITDHRAPLQAESLAELDLVLAIVENAVQALMQVRNVIAAIKIVVDKYLPVAV